MNGSSPKAVLLVINMGNYGHNCLPVKETFKKFRQHSQEVEFIAYHQNQSGNFVFVDSGEETRKRALETGEAVTDLSCLVRGFSELKQVDQEVPPEAQTTRRGSVILPTGEKLIHVALSKTVIEKARHIGRIGSRGSRVEILVWPSPQDVLCLYDRPQEGGNVGQVTSKVLRFLRNHSPDIYGTGRALSVIRDLLTDRNIRYG